ncbi:hypothetical protein FXO38_12881 [Capsicum annuum]|nr:hypothetical protein FXO38_12881 [Capsicum annuum]KAF3661842.1 hypothetical protein FXO37_12759 [Capsicum annuum]
MQKLRMARAHNGKLPPFKTKTNYPTLYLLQGIQSSDRRIEDCPLCQEKKTNVNSPEQGNTGTTGAAQNIKVNLFDVNSGKFLETRNFHYSTLASAKLATRSDQGYKLTQDPVKCPQGGPGRTNSSTPSPLGLT